jgi:hypothetical protein
MEVQRENEEKISRFGDVAAVTLLTRYSLSEIFGLYM